VLAALHPLEYIAFNTAPVDRLHHCFAPRDAYDEARRIRCEWVGHFQIQPIFQPAQGYSGRRGRRAGRLWPVRHGLLGARCIESFS
jgi:hypothetical protein